MYGRAGTMIDGNIFIGKQSHAFRRDLAAQLLVHNPEVTDANESPFPSAGADNALRGMGKQRGQRGANGTGGGIHSVLRQIILKFLVG